MGPSSAIWLPLPLSSSDVHKRVTRIIGLARLQRDRNLVVLGIRNAIIVISPSAVVSYTNVIVGIARWVLLLDQYVVIRLVREGVNNISVRCSCYCDDCSIRILQFDNYIRCQKLIRCCCQRHCCQNPIHQVQGWSVTLILLLSTWCQPSSCRQ